MNKHNANTVRFNSGPGSASSTAACLAARYRLAREPGFASVAVAGAMLALALTATLLLQVVYAVGERMETQNVADLCAISAAITYRDTGSPQEACTRAETLAKGYAVKRAVEGQAVRVTLGKQSAFTWVTGGHEASAVAGPARGP